MLLTEKCYNIENQGFGGVDTRDMSLIQTCFCSRQYGNLTGGLKRNKSWLMALSRVLDSNLTIFDTVAEQGFSEINMVYQTG